MSRFKVVFETDNEEEAKEIKQIVDTFAEKYPIKKTKGGKIKNGKTH